MYTLYGNPYQLRYSGRSGASGASGAGAGAASVAAGVYEHYNDGLDNEQAVAETIAVSQAMAQSLGAEYDPRGTSGQSGQPALAGGGARPDASGGAPAASQVEAGGDHVPCAVYLYECNV